MPDYHFPTCFSHKEIARLDFTKWKQIEANCVCAEESRIGEILCCYKETRAEQSAVKTDLQFLRQMTRRKKLWSSSIVSRTQAQRNIYGDGWDLYQLVFAEKQLFKVLFSWKQITSLKWYFATKIVLTYCEKNLFYWLRKNIWNSRLKAENFQNFWDH